MNCRKSLLVLAAILAATGAIAAPPFSHVIIVIQENRTPDNLFGSNPDFEPGVDIATSGITSRGVTVPLTAQPLANCYDVFHDHGAFKAAFYSGFDKVKTSPSASTGNCTLPPNPQFIYADNSTGTVQPYFDIASSYGFANRMFQTNQGASFAGHQFLFAGTSQPAVDSPLFVAENPVLRPLLSGCTAPPNQTEKLIDGYGSESSNPPIFPCLEHPTMADLLNAAPIPLSWRYISPTPGGITNAPEAIDHLCVAGTVKGKTVCTGPAFTSGRVIDTNSARILSDIAHCDLSAVTWVVPTAANSDHPGSNQGTGPAWVASIVNAVGTQLACPNNETYWTDTVIFVTWDDWGGLYDHVPPFVVNLQPNSPPAWGDGFTYGFRVPLLTVSAYTPAGFVDNNILDFGSILCFIEQNFGLGTIGGDDYSTYGQYADVQAAQRGCMTEFFSLSQPRGFSQIATKYPAAYFSRPGFPMVAPDDE